MRKYLKWFGLVPLAVVIPHWVFVLMTSPVDRGNIAIWGTIAVVLAIVGARMKINFSSEKGSFKKWGIAAVCCYVLAIAFVSGLMVGIWLISMSAAVAMAFITLVFEFGWRRAARFLPAFAALFIAVPGVIFWGERIGGIFSGSNGPACELRMSVLDGELPDGWMVRRAELTGAERMLFRTSGVRNYHIAFGQAFIHLSEVTMGADEHEIHPPAFCLRSQGMSLDTEREFKVEIPGHEPWMITETLASALGRRVVVWTWYTNDRESTDSFVRFRLKAGPGWKRYTLTADESPSVRAAFNQLISALL